MSERNENESLLPAIGMLMTVAGTPAAIIGIEKLDQNEAATPEDALASVQVGDRDYFVTHEDLAPGALAAAGLAIAIVGANLMVHRKKS